jgi:DNA-binding transcriptional MerR regulator
MSMSPSEDSRRKRHSVTPVTQVSKGVNRARVLRVHEAAAIHGLAATELLRRCQVIEALRVKSASSVIPADVLEQALAVPPEAPSPRPYFVFDDLSTHDQHILLRWVSTPRAFINAMSASVADDEVALLTTDEAAALAKVSPATIRQWRKRGHLYPSDLDRQRQPLYVPRLVLQAAQRSDSSTPDAIEHRDPDELLTVKAAASWLGVGPSTIRTWAHRGKVAPACINERGRSLYRAGDLAAAAQTTRQKTNATT